MKEYILLSLVLGLFAAGSWIALGSGGNLNLRTAEGRRVILDNVSGLLLRVFGYLAGLFAVTRAVGYPIGLPW